MKPSQKLQTPHFSSITPDETKGFSGGYHYNTRGMLKTVSMSSLGAIFSLKSHLFNTHLKFSL